VARPVAPVRGRRRRGAVLRRLVTWAMVAAITAPLVLAIVVGTRCYGGVLNDHAPGPRGVPGYLRAEAFTYLTYPEWYIVYSADEYARHVRRSPPSAFPFGGAVRQYWGAYAAACDATRGRYPFEAGYHVMLGVIGLSLTAEYGVKALYENTIGRATEWLFTTDTAEDVFAAGYAAEYGTFMHTTPWYQFPFGARLAALWGDVPWWGPHPVRKWERRLALSLELGAKAAYGWVMGIGSQATYGAEDQTPYARMPRIDGRALAQVKGRRLDSDDPVPVVALPRYEAFTPAAVALAERGQRFQDIAGNDDVLVSTLAPAASTPPLVPGARVVARQRVLTTPTRERLAVQVPVLRFHELVAAWRSASLAVEHVYDY
jgi:hypothetical protein